MKDQATNVRGTIQKKITTKKITVRWETENEAMSLLT